MATVKALSALLVLAALGGSVLCGPAAGEGVPLPRPRPGQVSPTETAPEGTAEEAAPPSACRLRLTDELAVAPSLPPLIGPGACNVDDVVRLEAVWLIDKTRVGVTPPAILRCSFAEAVVHWVREDVAPAVRSLGGALRSIDNFAAYDCRGRNRIIGARLSEHGRANALDIRSLKLANGKVVELTDPNVAKDFASVCGKMLAPVSPPCWAPAPTVITRITFTWTWPSAAAATVCASGRCASPGRTPCRYHRRVRLTRHDAKLIEFG
jgi:hypothetical protein